MSESKSNSDDAQYTVALNGKQYELNSDAREAIQTRAEHEFSENPMFSAFWKVASPDQYAEGEFENTIHESGDPVLVIETEGTQVPWDRMDTLNVEMQEAGPDAGLGSPDDDKDIDEGSGMKTLDPSDIGDPDQTIGRTHFGITPQSYEEVPSPDGEEADKVPPKPERMGDDPSLVAWVPDDPNVEHSWSTGEAITPMYNRVEWNVQVKANQPRSDKDTSHDHWESLLGIHGCDKLAELGPSQRTPSGSSQSSKSEEEVADKFKNGKYGGNNWTV